jgi:DHA3 family macrolide efflux protein-like MFS transporter
METKNTNWKRNVSFFIGGQFISMFGSMLVQHAITWKITLDTKSGLLMTLFTCAALLPMVIVSPFAGVWADRYNHKKIIVISDGCIAAATLILAVIYLCGFKNIWLLLFVVMGRSVGQGVQQPAVNAMLPRLVPLESLQRFNGIQGTVQSITMLGSPLFGGALLSFMPIEYIFFIDVVTAAIGIFVVYLFVKTEYIKKKRTDRQGLKAYFNELREGIAYIGKSRWLKTLMFYGAFFSFMVCPAAFLTPLQTARTFGDDVWRLTALEIAFSLGMLLGGILISVWGGLKNKTHTVILAFTVCGVFQAALGLVPWFWVYLGVMLLCGITVPSFNTPTMTVLQSNIEPHIIGRVMGVYMMLSGFAMPLGMAVFGPLGDTVKIEWLLVISGAVILAGGLSLLGAKDLLRIGGLPAKNKDI